MVVFKTKNASQTENLGRRFAKNLQDSSDRSTSSLYSDVVAVAGDSSGALILSLSGDLGSGKTTFVKGLAKGLGIKEIITSPTYVFARSYKFPEFKIGDQVKNKFYHLDLYRLDGPDAKVLNSIEFQEIIQDPLAIVAIEWAERLESEDRRLNNPLKIQFSYNQGGRSLTVY